MPEFVADDAVFIASRLKEIEAEKQKAREKPGDVVNEQAIEEAAAKRGADDDAWMGY